jgi:hypothetical protein
MWLWWEPFGTNMTPHVRPRVVAIHQPTFFPWLGYFNKVAYADTFIVLDSVPISKTGGTWLNRVRLLLNGRVSWVTMPIVRAYHGAQLIRHVQMDGVAWRGKLLRTLQGAYGRAPHFEMVFPLVAALIKNQTDSLAEFNLSAIRALSVSIGLDPAKLIVGSTLGVSGKGSELLVELVKSVGGTAYLCGDGAAGYQEDEKFHDARIDVVYQRFQHPVYQQRGASEFKEGLSIVDTLMNCGFDATRDLVLGSKPSMNGEYLGEATSVQRLSPERA